MVHWQQVPEGRKDEGWITIVAIQVTMQIVGVITAFSWAIPMLFFKVIIEDMFERFS